MKKIMIACLWSLLILTLTTVSAQQVKQFSTKSTMTQNARTDGTTATHNRDFTLTGAPDNGEYPGYGGSGLFSVTLTVGPDANDPTADLPAGSLIIQLSNPTNIEFGTYTPPSGWSYTLSEDKFTATLTQTAPISPVPPASIISFTIPISITGKVEDGAWSARLLDPTDSSPMNDHVTTNNITSGTVIVVDALPVSLASFNVKEQEGMAVTTWTTTEEVKFEKFELQRSLLGHSQFTTIGTIAAKGQAGKGSSYEFTDQDSPKGEMLYYRLKMIDFDGSFAYSTIQSIKLSGESHSVYPNPAISYAKVSSHDSIRSLKLINLSGFEVKSVTFSGRNKIETIELNGVPTGVYQIKVEGSNGTLHYRKLVVGN